MSEAVALNKKEQNKFSKKVKHVKEKVSKGVIKIQENIKKRKPRKIFGLIYIGHIPHGFYEEEMKKYFKQFGVVTNVRVCRSRKTGQSKGYGFIQFLHPEVAQIAAETMNNYLMFNRRLICKYIPPEKQRKNIFTKIQWSTKNYPLKIARKKHLIKRNENPSQKDLVAATKNTLTKFRKKMNKLATLGIEYTFMPNDVPEDMTNLLQDSSCNIGESKSRINVTENINTKITKMQKLNNNFKVTTAPIIELKRKSLKSIIKKKDKLKKSVVPKMSFMQSDRLKRLAAAEVMNDIVKKVKLKKAPSSRRKML